MMGPAQRMVPKLYYTQFNLEERVGADHPLRAVRAAIDFDFVRGQVKHLYGRRGNPSVDPAVLLKLMFLVFYENLASERALLARMPERLDWLWFCGFDLDDELPDHSVLSKARRRWGVAAFEEFFGQVLGQCLDAGLIDGQRVHIDSSLIRANASKDSLRVTLRAASGQLYEQLEQAAEAGPNPPAGPPAEPVPADSAAKPALETAAANSPVEPAIGTPVSPTDPDARLTRKYGQTVLGYKDHRVVDDRCGIITATITTAAAAADPHLLGPLLDEHEANTAAKVQVAAADKAYGTADNYKELASRDVTPCIPHQRRNHDGGEKFGRAQFVYDRDRDCFTCPAGQSLTPRTLAKDGRWRYGAAKGVCASCALRASCTDNVLGRQLSRDADQDVIDWADGCLSASQRRWWMRRRKIRVEGSFADAANRHGYKRARWRGLVTVTIQNLLIAAMQNLRKLLRWRPGPGKRGQAVGPRPASAFLAGVSDVALFVGSMAAALRQLRAMPLARPAPPT